MAIAEEVTAEPAAAPVRDGRTTAEKPWLLRPRWAGPEVRSGGGPKVAWAVAVLWNAIAAPLGVVSTLEFLEGNKAAAFGMLFPLVGAGMLAWAIRRTLAWRRFGEASLVMDPYPGAIGGQVGGTVDVRLPYDPSEGRGQRAGVSDRPVACTGGLLR